MSLLITIYHSCTSFCFKTTKIHPRGPTFHSFANDNKQRPENISSASVSQFLHNLHNRVTPSTHFKKRICVNTFRSTPFYSHHQPHSRKGGQESQKNQPFLHPTTQFTKSPFIHPPPGPTSPHDPASHSSMPRTTPLFTHSCENK